VGEGHWAGRTAIRYLQINGNSQEFIAANSDLKPFFFVGPDLFGPRDLSRK